MHCMLHQQPNEVSRIAKKETEENFEVQTAAAYVKRFKGHSSDTSQIMSHPWGYHERSKLVYMLHIGGDVSEEAEL